MHSQTAQPSRTPRTRRRRLPLRALGLAAALLTITASAAAQQPAPEHRLQWHWRRFATWEYVATAGVAAGALYLSFGTEQSEQARWKSPVWFEASARDWLRFEGASQRENASLVSDYLGFATQAWAYLDTSVVPLATDRGNLDVSC
jgi:hypothetical protein